MSNNNSALIDTLTNSLKLDRDLPRVASIRKGDLEYLGLKKASRNVFAERRCIVVGSSPHFIPPILRAGDLIFTVNGSAHQLSRLGVAVSDVALINGAIFSPAFQNSGVTEFSEVSEATIDVLTKSRTEHCFISTNSYSLQDTQRRLADIDFGSKFTYEMKGLHRAALIGEVCGAELGFGGLEERVSTGVTAICLALWGGAIEVVSAGFSLKGGHCYISSETRRWHSIGDSEFFRICAQSKMPVSTTNRQLADQFRISLAQH